MVIVFCIPLFLTGCGPSGDDAYAVASEAYQEGDYEKAIKFYTKAAENSGNPAIFANRANCHSYLGDLEAALRDYDLAIAKALEISNDASDPRLAYFYYNRGFAYENAKKYDQAIPDYARTISLNDDYLDVKNNLAWILATCPIEKLRDPERAVALAESECRRTDWKDASILDTLAAAHAAAGNFDMAIKRQEQAIDLAQDADILAACRTGKWTKADC